MNYPSLSPEHCWQFRYNGASGGVGRVHVIGRNAIYHGSLLFLVIGAWSLPCLAQESPLSRKNHLWGRFEPGAWNTVRVVTETLDEKGLVTSTNTTETTTVLATVDKNGVTLEVYSTIEVAGKRFEAEPEVVKQGFHCEPSGKEMTIKDPAAGQVVIEGRKIPCNVQQIECTAQTSKTAITVSYSDTVPPYMLRRECTTTDPEGKNTISETTVEIEALDMPWQILMQRKPTATVKTTYKHPKGTVITWAQVSAEVPGGIVSHTSKELDKNGRVIRRSTLELVNYGLQCDDDPRIGPVLRKRRARLREGT
jgi:hypothetical protein